LSTAAQNTGSPGTHDTAVTVFWPSASTSETAVPLNDMSNPLEPAATHAVAVEQLALSNWAVDPVGC
jgi:hypothetical protein